MRKYMDNLYQVFFNDGTYKFYRAPSTRKVMDYIPKNIFHTVIDIKSMGNADEILGMVENDD